MTVPYKFLTQERKIINYNIERHNVITDLGAIFESTVSNEFYRAVELQTDLGMYDTKNKILIEWNIYTSNKTVYYFRKYVKIPEILASVGGFLKILNLLFAFINSQVATIVKHLSTIENVFERDEAYNVNTTNITNAKLMDFTNVREDILKIKTKVNNPNRKLMIKVTFCDFLKISCRKIYKVGRSNSINVNLYEKGSSIVRNYFDFLYIIKKMLEIEYLKKVLMNEKQIKLFSLIKPNLHEEILNRDCNEVEINNLFENADVSNELDRKILLMIK
jgi:hypothetical protein